MPPTRPVPAKAGLADLKRLTREAREADERQREAEAARLRAAAERDARTTQSTRAAAAGSGGQGVSRRSPAGQTPRTEASAQDLALFRRVAGDVRAVDARNRRPDDPPRPIMPPRRASRDTASDPEQSASPQAGSQAVSDADVSHLLIQDGTAYLRQGVGPDVLKKLGERYWRLDASLDLHGLTVEAARDRLTAFVTQCIAYDARCIRIVHGQGFGSPEAQPVLRDKVRAWLVGLPDVRAFAQATTRDGGAGATVALLRVDERRARDRRDRSGAHADGEPVSRT